MNYSTFFKGSIRLNCPFCSEVLEITSKNVVNSIGGESYTIAYYCGICKTRVIIQTFVEKEVGEG